MNANRYNILIAVAMLVAVVPLQAQTTPPAAADFTKAALAEVRNAQGQIVLTGKFVVSEEDDDDIERKAPLAGIDPDAAGEAEVELSGSGNAQRQEVEFSAKNLQPGAAYTFIIDGAVFATVTADSKGRAALERDVPLLRASGSR